jgi:tRNA-Thr(GGU) m(6)t(6)A37 methyltransferase TsaA
MAKRLLIFRLIALGFFFFPTFTDFWGYAMEASLNAFTLQPVGVVKKDGDKTRLVINEAYKDGLLGLEGFSHVYVYFWFDKNDTHDKRAILRVHPMGNQSNPLTGVFATRSPVRPNLIGMTLVKVLAVSGSTVEVDWIDALDNTPIVDIKPFIPTIDCADSPKIPKWLDDDGWVKGPRRASSSKNHK